MQTPHAAAQAIARRFTRWPRPIVITPLDTRPIPHAVHNVIGSWKKRTAPVAASAGAAPRAIGYATLMSAPSNDLIRHTRYATCRRISALNPSMSARLDILSLPDFSTALTIACAAPDATIMTEASCAGSLKTSNLPLHSRQFASSRRPDGQPDAYSHRNPDRR